MELTSEPEPIYAQDPNDAWNRIFYFLFSRRMEIRLSDEFPEGTPFTKEGINLNLLRLGLRSSTGTLERNATERLRGAFKRTEIQVYEISRKLLLREPESGGLVTEEQSSPAYVGGLSFASSYFPIGIGQYRVGPPVQIKLRTRCIMCHWDSNLTQVRTFATVIPPHPPRVKQLDSAGHEQADIDITEKAKRNDFQSLRRYFR